MQFDFSIPYAEDLTSDADSSDNNEIQKSTPKREAQFLRGWCEALPSCKVLTSYYLQSVYFVLHDQHSEHYFDFSFIQVGTTTGRQEYGMMICCYFEV